jgi:peptidoglycan hydrolase-like protein with peptidoglycan-binding domain
MRRFAFLLAIFASVCAPAGAGASTGADVWNQAGCGGCHTLAAAGSNGNVGPNLDQLRPSKARVAAQVGNGGPAMPSFASSLSAVQIDALAAYVSSATGGGSVPTAGSGSARTTASAMSATSVRDVQRALHRLGFFNGPVTGFYGPLTQAAVATFQQSVGLPADGIWGPASAAALRRARPATQAAATSLPPPAAWVRRLQRDLARLSYFKHAVTGVYGPITTAAVQRFQAAAGLTADGKWGPQSQAALMSRLHG